MPRRSMSARRSRTMFSSTSQTAATSTLSIREYSMTCWKPWPRIPHTATRTRSFAPAKRHLPGIFRLSQRARWRAALRQVLQRLRNQFLRTGERITGVLDLHREIAAIACLAGDTEQPGEVYLLHLAV